jgi:hypothetical protein
MVYLEERLVGCQSKRGSPNRDAYRVNQAPTPIAETTAVKARSILMNQKKGRRGARSQCKSDSYREI